MSTLSPDAQASKTPPASHAQFINLFKSQHKEKPLIIVLSETLAEIEHELQDMYQFRRKLTEAQSYLSRNFLDHKINLREAHKRAVMADYIGEVMNAGRN